MEENIYNTSVDENIQSTDFFGNNIPSENEMAAANLQVLLEKLEGEDKCVVCQAIQVLQKKDTQSTSSWTYLLPLIIFGFLGTSPIDSKLIDAFVKAYTNVKDEESDNND